MAAAREDLSKRLIETSPMAPTGRFAPPWKQQKIIYFPEWMEGSWQVRLLLRSNPACGKPAAEAYCVDVVPDECSSVLTIRHAVGCWHVLYASGD